MNPAVTVIPSHVLRHYVAAVFPLTPKNRMIAPPVLDSPSLAKSQGLSQLAIAYETSVMSFQDAFHREIAEL